MKQFISVISILSIATVTTINMAAEPAHSENYIGPQLSIPGGATGLGINGKVGYLTTFLFALLPVITTLVLQVITT